MADERSNGSPALRSSVRRWDAAVAAWTIGCSILAVWTGFEIHRLTDISDTLASSSRALDSTAVGLRQVAAVPFVGDEVTEVADRIAETAERARASSQYTRTTIDRISVLIGLAIVLIAVVPPVVAYLVVRRALTRSGRARHAWDRP